MIIKQILKMTCGSDRKYSDRRFTAGFTLVELLVAMSIFIVIVTVAVGVFVNALKEQRFLTNEMAMNNNMGLVLEEMAREMRTGYQFQAAGGSCGSNGSTGISFYNSQDSNATGGSASTVYSFANGGITRQETGAVDASKNTSGVITSSDINVENGCFTVMQDSGTLTKSTCNPPRIVIRMEVASTAAHAPAPSFIETTVSSRILPSEIKDDPYQCRTQ